MCSMPQLARMSSFIPLRAAERLPLAETLIKHTPESFLEHARKELLAGELCQATEKLWGAASSALQDRALELGYKTNSHAFTNALFRSMAGQCSDNSKELKLLWRSAGACHANFYNSFMLASEVYKARFEIEQLVKEIQSLDLGRFDKAAFQAYLRTEMSNEELSRLKIV
jgi:Archaeal PaREP1/PaREP8 family